MDDKSGLELSTEQRKELSTASDDELNEINDQRYTGNVKSQNRKQRKQITVKTADRPDEYDYDSSDEEVCIQPLYDKSDSLLTCLLIFYTRINMFVGYKEYSG